MQPAPSPPLPAPEPSTIFRRDALDAQERHGRRGDVVRVSPTWVDWGYGIVLLTSLAALAFVIFGRVGEYGRGPAFVYSGGRSDLVAPVSGNVAAVHVGPGDTVRAGDDLARFASPEESARLARLEAEWQSRLREYLASPNDAQVRRSLGELRGERARARERLTVRADRSGTVMDVRVTPGASVAQGETMLSITDGESPLMVAALLPSGDAALLRDGMPMRFRIEGHRHAGETVPIVSVGDELVSSQEALRVLGGRLGDTVRIDGPVVLVRAELPATFVADGERYSLHHGMAGEAEVRLRSTNIWKALFPALRRWE